MRESQQSNQCRELLPVGGKPCRLPIANNFGWKLFLFLLGGLLTVAVQKSLGTELSANRGDFAADLSILKNFCSGPQNEKESNYFLDMWAGRQLAQIARLNGLTNNHTLFINSHGRGGLGFFGNRYGFYPHQSLRQSKAAEPVFSAQDIARMLGPEKVASIHNVVISSCDLESCFSAPEIKKWFPNAVTIIHTPRGQAGYQPMFYSALVNPSSEVQPLYETKIQRNSNTPGYHISSVPAAGAKKLNPYMAELYLPGAQKPYRTQIAGRELLEQAKPSILLSQIQRMATVSP
ncbi:MAG: hypothetical protein JWM16_941 [Verrucomicrobiales bacterium]|nr:hypothetical protein [Verrucomicrobiales bacterium]